jgi:hypothetical protein
MLGVSIGTLCNTHKRRCPPRPLHTKWTYLRKKTGHFESLDFRLWSPSLQRERQAHQTSAESWSRVIRRDITTTLRRHIQDTHDNGKLTGKVLVRRHVYFKERSFPARKMTPKNPMSKHLKPDDGSGLIGLTFVNDGESFRVTGTHVEDGRTY